VLEKALSTSDFAKQKQPLAEILRQLKPLHLRSLEELDFNTRGRLLTTLLRVGRQKKPPEPPPAAVGSPAEPESAGRSESEAAPGQAETAEAPPEASEPASTSAELAQAPSEAVEAAQSAAETGASQPPDSTPADGASADAGSVPATVTPAPQARSLSPEEEKLAAYCDALFLVGLVWKAVGDEGRAEPAFAASGRQFTEPEKVKAPSAPPSGPRSAPRSGDWRDEARRLESQKRTRDAARLYERHDSPGEAAKLYETGGDLKSALKNYLSAKDSLAARRLLGQLKPEQFLPIIEKTGAYELLMEHYVDAGELDNVAKLYERARQFDQAALAWEKSGKLAAARKAYERAKDSANAERVRQLEVEKLVERGDRLGAAVLLQSAGKKNEAVQTLLALPAAKAYRFLQKMKFDDEALALARKEIEQAEAGNKPGASARWLEMLGDLPAAAEAWKRAERKDRALAVYEQAGDWQQAGQIAESLGERDKAVEMYQRAGDSASAERAAALPAQVVAPPPSGESVALDREGEEG
jgi:tetratricopeptide (TPR) repeat protein